MNTTETSVSPSHYGYKQIWSIAWPLIISGVGQMLNNVMDTAFMGRLGEVELGAIAIAVMYFFSLSMAMIGFTTALQIIVARSVGEKKMQAVGQYFWFGILLVLLLAGLFIGLNFVFNQFVLVKIIKDSAILFAVESFLNYRIFGYVTIGLLYVFRSFYLGIAQTKIIGYTTALVAAFNFLFNVIFVFGYKFIPAMGIAGSAIATTLAELTGVILLIVFTFFQKQTRATYYLFNIKLPSKQNQIDLVKMALPLVFQFFIAMFGWFVFFLIIEQTGKLNLAISNLTRSMYLISMLVLIAFSGATATIISNLVGQQKIKEIFPTLKRISALSLLCSTIVCSVIAFIVPQLLGIFTSNESLIQQSILCVYIILGSTLVFSVSFMLMSAISGLGDTIASLCIEIITLIFYLYCSYLLALKWKLAIHIIWLNEYVYFVVMGLVCALYLKYAINKRIKALSVIT